MSLKSSCFQIIAVCVLGFAAPLSHASSEVSVPIHWLGEKSSPLPTGVSFGVPWPRGSMKATQAFALTGPDGKSLQVQSWPLAYWPDGTVKWTGIATVVAPEIAGEFKLTTTSSSVSPKAAKVVVRSSDASYEIDTGRLKARVLKTGSNFIDSLVIGGHEVARDGQLVCVLQQGPDGNSDDTPARERYRSRVDRVTLEQSGPVRAVIKIEGQHVGLKSGRSWLPFVVRLYFYAGTESVRMVHSFVFDGDDQKDFIRGLGVVFSVPLREQVQNRHVRFSGENGGLWAEPIQPLIGRGGRGRTVSDPGDGADVYPTQLEGKRVPDRDQVNPRGQKLLADWAVWDDFKLVQPNADGFNILKRTNPESVWLPAGAGRRASGLVFVGDVSGGFAVSLKNFWQSYPASLEVRKASASAAELTVWLWSPDAAVMDLRHYDTRAHGLDSVYEDVQPGFSTAHGVARTSELMLFPTASVPTKEDTIKMAQVGTAPPLLLCTSKYLQSANAFGYWGLADSSTPVKAAIETQLARTLDFYLAQPGQQNWYGFWDFGDVMHSYDEGRHTWRYDLGGMAWDNSELGTDMWLWYSFLRTGRADVFRMAEAMTRHTGEVDCYHLGKFAGLGSRHNVRHWGCGAKEARISQAAYRRFYYYLTTDERVGDVMREMLNADFKTVDYDPMRLAQPITEAEKKIAPTRVRLGPDWFAFLGNWMTEWERTGDTKWRDKILAGVESLDAMPLGLRSGRNLVFGYDPTTGRLYRLNDEAGVYNLATIMGGAEVVFELNMMLDDARWKKLWLQYCQFYKAPADALAHGIVSGNDMLDASFVRDGRLAAYVYHETKNEAFLREGIDALLKTARGERSRPVHRVAGVNVLNPVDEGLAGTNGAAQNGLETIAMLGLIGDHLPGEFPAKKPD